MQEGKGDVHPDYDMEITLQKCNSGSELVFEYEKSPEFCQ